MNKINYPLGADTKDAPWNEVPNPIVEFNACISQSLSKTVKVKTDDYTIEVDDDADGLYEYPDTTNTDWKQAYKDSKHLTPLEIIMALKNLATELLEENPNRQNAIILKHLIEECNNWQEDELEVIQD